MSGFTDAEITFPRERRRGRLVTTAPDGRPHVVPVDYLLNPTADGIDVVGTNMSGSVKACNVTRTGQAALVVDDIVSVVPYRTRHLHVSGPARVVLVGDGDERPTPPGPPGMTPEMREIRARNTSPELIRIMADRIVSAGLDDPTLLTP